MAKVDKKKMGKPLMYNDGKKLQKCIDAYFDSLIEKNDEGEIVEIEYSTFTGLAYHLGFCERRSLNDYAALDNESLSTPVKRAMLRIEIDYEKQLRKQSCTGAIFALKNRGWVDKQEIHNTGEVSIIDILNQAHKKASDE